MRKLYAIANIYEEGKEEPLHKNIRLHEETIKFSMDVGINCKDIALVTKHMFSIEVVTFDEKSEGIKE